MQNVTVRALVLGVLVACGGSQERPTERALSDALGETHVQSTRVRPPAGEPARQYRVEEASPVPDRIGPYAEAALSDLRRDGRLDLLAQWVLAHGDYSESERRRASVLPASAIDAAARHLGLVEPAPHLLVGTAGSFEQVAEALAGGIAAQREGQSYTHYGLASVEIPGGFRAAVVFSRRSLELTPFARSASPGDSILLRGTLSGLYQPTLVVTRGRTVQRIPLGRGPQFESTLEAEEDLRRVEIMASGDAGPVVVLNVPLHVGRELPREIEIPPPAEPEHSAEEVEETLWALLAEFRRAHGLEQLQREPSLRRASEVHNQDMIENGFIAHHSEQTGSASDRVQATGFRTDVVLENIGLGRSGVEIHRGLLDSPAHRANLLHDDITHAGIAVSQSAGGEYLATQIFGLVNAEVDIAEVEAEMLAAVQAAREARGLSPLRRDEGLRRAARDGASTYFESGASRQEVLDRTGPQALQLTETPLASVGGLLAIGYRPEELAEMEALLSPEVDIVGLGAAQGTREGDTPNQVAVMILVGTAR